MKLKYLILLSLLAALFSCATTGTKDKQMELPNFDEKWDYDDPAGTQLVFSEILNQVDYKGNPIYHLELRTQIARTLGLQQKYTEAHRLLDEVEQDLTPAHRIPRIRYLLERGRVINSSGEPAKSISYFLEAWELASNEKAEFYAVDAAHMLGIVESPELKLEWNEKAVKLSESSTDPRAKKWLGSLYNNIGWTYHDNGEYEKALEVFKKTYDWYEEQEDEKRSGIAEWSIARTHRSMGDPETALEIQTKLAREMATSGEEDGYVYEEIAECLHAMGESAEAKPYFEKAWRILSQDIWLQQNESDRLERLKTMGGVTP